MRQSAPASTSRASGSAGPCARLAQGLRASHRLAQVNTRRAVAAQAGTNKGGSPAPSFEEHRFHRVCLVRKSPYGPLKMLPPDPTDTNAYSGLLVFKKESEMLSSDTKILEVFVSGDTAGNIYALLNNHSNDRPMVHDLMWSMVAQMAATHRQQWQLLKVAIVALKDDVFIGRLYFGDPVTQEIMWDCDCRPSDGCYLHLKSGCPFFVVKEVWDQATVPVRLSKVHLIAQHEARMLQEQQFREQVQQSAPPPPPLPQYSNVEVQMAGQRQAVQSAVATATSPAVGEYTSLRPEDPDQIKLLKRELAVAVAEEDYTAAIRIRDHPYMQLYRRIQALVHFGRQQEAEELEAELHGMIRRHD